MNYKKALSVYFIIPALMSSFKVTACPFCHTSTGIAVHNGLLHHHFLLMLGALIAISAIFILIVLLTSDILAHQISHQVSFQTHGMNPPRDPVKIIRDFLLAGMLLGGGAAGFVDGILFHQILQWHSMMSNQLPLNSVVNIEINMFWDGVFHVFMLLITLTSFGLLWISRKQPKSYQSTDTLMGCIFLGAGLFNLVEGLIDHYFLQLHHVIQAGAANSTFYADIIFLVVAVIAMGLGSFYIRKGMRHA